jgi:hypothetical protein
MKLRSFALAFSFSVFFLAGTACAWNDLGHRVVAQIAWNQLDKPTKTAIIQALKNAPADTKMLRVLPANKNLWPADVNNALYAKLFQSVATWPDLVRPDQGNPQPTDKYHHGDWHYVNVFWKGSTHSPTGQPNAGFMLSKLAAFSGTQSNENPAIQVAWLVHLTGDAHQPMHCSARITSDPVEKDGDRGANEFCLASGCRTNFTRLNLHSFWDSSLTRNNDQGANQSVESFAWEIAKSITDEHPASEFANTNGFTSSSLWSDEGVRIAIDDGYPATLIRNQTPTQKYRLRVYEIARQRIALAGYRLAATLKAKFGS